VGGFKQTGKFVSGNESDIFGAAAVDDDYLAVFQGSVA
jgi:hypothetical protein